MDQLRQGRLDLRRLEAVRDRVRNLPSVALIAEVEDALLEVAPGLTHSQLGRRTTALVAQADPTGYEQRHQKAKADRRVEIRPLPDGMAHLTAILPAVEARMIHDLLCADAKDLPKDERTTDQKRADAFLDRFLGNVGKRDVQVHVTISMETLMGLTEDPALLEGYGPISADTARELAMDGIWRAILLDEHDHADTIGKHTYRPGRRLKELVGVRAGSVCSAPGCTRPIQEGDHVTPWPKATPHSPTSKASAPATTTSNTTPTRSPSTTTAPCTGPPHSTAPTPPHPTNTDHPGGPQTHTPTSHPHRPTRPPPHRATDPHTGQPPQSGPPPRATPIAPPGATTPPDHRPAGPHPAGPQPAGPQPAGPQSAGPPRHPTSASRTSARRTTAPPRHRPAGRPHHPTTAPPSHRPATPPPNRATPTTHSHHPTTPIPPPRSSTIPQRTKNPPKHHRQPPPRVDFVWRWTMA
ncbi:DUF222 domain-containing protein [Kutzneria buriramensis]